MAVLLLAGQLVMDGLGYPLYELLSYIKIGDLY